MLNYVTFFDMTGSPDCRLFSIREIPHDVGYLQSKSKRDQLKQGKPRGSCVLPHKGGLSNYNERFRDKISPQCRNSMHIFLQQSGDIRKPLNPAKYENFYEIFLHFYDYRLYLVKKYIFLYDMNDIFGVFRPVF